MLNEDAPWPPFFGEPWPSGICETGYQVDTPVGTKCIGCSEVIIEGDRGQLMPYMGELKEEFRVPAGYEQEIFCAQHRECMMRSVMGGIEHLTAGPHEVGTCYHDSKLTYRESALQAWDWIKEHGVPNG